MITFNPIHVLFQIAGFKVYIWGLMFVLGFLAAFLLSLREAKKQGLQDEMWIIGLLILVGAVIGPRLFYVIEHLGYFSKHLLEILTMWQGGITSYGAYLGLFLAWLYVKKKKLNFLRILDIISPYILLAIAITRIGCFLNWDDFGIQSSLPWAIRVAGDVARHPTQLYESLYCLIIFGILIWFKKIRETGKLTKFKKLLNKNGALFLFFLIFYSLARFFNDFLRVYDTYWFGLAISQWICILLFVLSLILLFRKK
jgi:phosphatidylglycerol---prolipoprotein diacylglyceryl transferase